MCLPLYTCTGGTCRTGVSATDGGVMALLDDGFCGITGRPCCGVASYCAVGAVCVDHVCQAGSVSERPDVGVTMGPPDGGATMEPDGSACGTVGLPCCGAMSSCAVGTTCMAHFCQASASGPDGSIMEGPDGSACGTAGLPCCGSNSLCMNGGTCVGHICQP